MVSKCWWGTACCGDATRGYIKHNASRMGYTLCIESQKKKNEKLAKVTMGMSGRTMGSVQCNPGEILS